MNPARKQNAHESGSSVRLQWYFVIAAALFTVAFTAVFTVSAALLERVGQLTQDEFFQQVYALDPASTAEDLIRQGYIDLTEIQPGVNEDITEFLRRTTANQYATLKTFTRTGDGLVVTALWGFSLYRSTTYSVPQQSALNPGQAFMDWYERPSGDGDHVIEVWLRAYPYDNTVRNGQDVLLYRYQTE